MHSKTNNQINMAKVTFLQGKARGKVGGIVYRTEAGIGTIASEYNPSPRNPRTIAQTNQRGKMNFAGRLSKITPYAAIAGLGSTRRAARARFVSEALRTVSGGLPEGRFTIPVGMLKLSDGIDIAGTGTVAYTEATRTVTCTLDFSDASVSVLGAIVVAYVGLANETPVCLVRKLEHSTGVVSFILPATLEGSIVHVYAIPIVDTGENVRVAFAQLEIRTSDLNASITRTIAQSGGYANSMFIDMINTES